MSVKNKKRGSFLEPKNLIVTSIAAIFVILVAVAMSFMQPKPEDKGLDEAAWKEAVTEAEEQKNADSGALTPVYSESVASAVAKAEEKTEDEGSAERIDEAVTDEEEKEKAQAENTAADLNLSLAPPVAGAVSFDYSGDELVYSNTMQDWRTHNGVDFAAPEGAEVFASAAGTVEAVTDGGMFGTTVIILHSGGLRTIYSNLAPNDHAAAGDTVEQGTVIGKVGSTAVAEAAEEPHLHFEISKDEVTVNPHDYLPDTGDAE